MDDVRGDVLGPPHGTTLAAVIANKIKKNMRSFKSSEHINDYYPMQRFDNHLVMTAL